MSYRLCVLPQEALYRELKACGCMKSLLHIQASLCSPKLVDPTIVTNPQTRTGQQKFTGQMLFLLVPKLIDWNFLCFHTRPNCLHLRI